MFRKISTSSIFTLLWVHLGAALGAIAADCNRNDIPDTGDVVSGFSLDCNENGVPDECESFSARFGLFEEGLLVDGPESVVVLAEDIDHDGRIDFVTGNRDDLGGSISVFVNQGMGDFEPERRFQAGASLHGLVPIDLDGDGDTDLAVAADREITLIENQGDGNFSLPQSMTVAPGTLAVHSADINSDGQSDLLALNRERNELWIMENAGGSNFHVPITLTTGDGPIALASADLSGNHRPDLAVANQDSGDISVFLNLGDGRFTSSGPHSAAGDLPHSIEAADLDGDSDVDLLVASGGALSVLENDGTGSFEPAVPVAGPSDAATLGDFDGDGDLDLANLAASEVTILVNEGDGHFLPLWEFAVERFPSGLTAIDADDDGDLDLALLRNSRFVSILWNEQPATTSFASTVVPLGKRPHGGAMGDVNDDGYADVVTANGHNLTISVFLSLGDGSFSPAVSYKIETAGHLNSVALGDLDNDGDTDVISADRELNRFDVFLNTGDGTLLEPSHYAAGRGAFHLDAGDLDGDDLLDLVSANEEGGSITVAFNQGEATFGAQQEIRAGTRPVAVDIADINRDGWADITVANDTSRTVSIHLNQGGRVFAPAVEYPVLKRCESIEAVDVDLDGHTDLVAASGSAGVSWLRNEGGDAFALQTLHVPRQPLAATVVDVNQDGIPDIVTLNQSTSSVGILLGESPGVFRKGLLIPTGELPRIILSGDVDADGDTDLIAGNRIGQDLTLLYNQNRHPLRQDYLESVCTEADFFGVSRSGEPSGVVARVARFVVARTPSPDVPPVLFPHGARFSSHMEFLQEAFPERFSQLSPPELEALTGQRATREYYIGTISRLRVSSPLDLGATHGFSVNVDPSNAVERLTLEETEAVYNSLRQAFNLGALGYLPADVAQLEAAILWDDPAFSIFLPDGTLYSSPGGARFRRGDTNADGRVNISDASFILNFLFLGNASPTCEKSADADDSGELLITDALFLLGELFLGGSPLAPPGAGCGGDPTPDELGCEDFSACDS